MGASLEAVLSPWAAQLKSRGNLPVLIQWGEHPAPDAGLRLGDFAQPKAVIRVRKATAIVEKELKPVKAFQYMAILHEDRFAGMRNGRRDFGLQIEVRCWNSVDAREATPVWLPAKRLERLAKAITSGVPGVVSVTYNIAAKPPSTMEAV